MFGKEPIDVLSIRNKMQENCNFRSFLKRADTIVNSSCIATFGALSLATMNPIADMILLIISGYNMFSMSQKWERYKDIDTRLALILEETPVYRRMSENYFTFVHSVAKFLKKFELKDTKELLCLLELMLQSGYFSYNFSHEYHKYKIDTGEMSGTTGAHVVTGKCVCRHMAAMFSDLLHQLNIEGCNLTVRVKYENEVDEFLKSRKKQEFNHAVVGVIDGDSKFMFDPTNNVFAGKSDTKFKGYEMDQVGQTEIKEKNSYIFTSSESIWANKLHLDEYKKYIKLPMEELDFGRIEKAREKMLEFYLKNKTEFDLFYHEMLSMLQDVYHDIIQLSPKSDDEIKEWILKY